MVVSLTHAVGIVTNVEAAMIRAPWSSCPGAIARLQETFTGALLKEVARRGEKATNCTHLHDLTLFAAAYAEEIVSTAYDIFVTDPVLGVVHAVLRRDGATVLDWTLVDQRLTTPRALAGRRLTEIGDWILACDPATREAARLLRWATIMALGRQMDIPAGSPATMFPLGACYTFQPARAETAFRASTAWIDFSQSDNGPMAEHSEQFATQRKNH